ncbi:MAG: hypothetical protein QG635_1089, partial [Bacteroidota bacterium]|nr:hypothetical protein [Bacteroidota bacterium]
MKKTILILLLALIYIAAAQNNLNYSMFKDEKYSVIDNRTADLVLQDTIPANFPAITINASDNPAAGNIFLTSINTSSIKSNFIMALDNFGKPVYYYKPLFAGIDFKMQPNGMFSYSEPVKIGSIYQAGPINVQNVMVINYILDETYKKIDSVQCQNSYLADLHDFIILPNGHYLMLAYEPLYVDMSKIVPEGNPNALVIGTVIQELDHNKRCIFQWRSYDNIPITDTQDNILNAYFEHVHGNAFHLDADGNLLV